MAPNGGSASYVNEYTVVYDLFLPASTDSTWRSLLQTTTTPGGNDGDYFVSSGNAIGVGSIGYSSSTVAADDWYRVVFSADIGDTIDGGTGSFITTVIDSAGSSWSFDHAPQGLDGRHSLYSTANSNIVHFFADDNGEDNEVYVSNLALFDTPLNATQVEGLGGPGDPIVFIAPPVLDLDLYIDRDTGRMQIENNTGNDVEIRGYSIESADGTLNTANWKTITGNYDGPGDDSVDDEAWLQLSASDAKYDLSEAAFGAGLLADGQVVDLNSSAVATDPGPWNKYYKEDQSVSPDLTFSYINGAGETRVGNVYFQGSLTESPFDKGDLNYDGSIDSADWDEFVKGLGTDMASLTAAESYVLGDMNGDGMNNYFDFVEFERIYDLENGTGALAAVLGSSQVPEPSTIGLLALAACLGGLRRLRKPVLGLSACLLCVIVASTSSAAVPVPNALFEFNDNLDNTSPFVGGSTATASGFTPVYADATIGGQPARVIDLPDFAANEGLAIANTAAMSPAGAAYTNNFTLIVDINIPDTTADFTSLLNTNPGNSNDVDWFSRPGDPSGVDIGGKTSVGVLTSNTWYRLALINDNQAGTNVTSFYVDGQFIDSVNNGGTDGTWSLEETFFMFADDSGENNAKFVNNVGYWGEALSPLQVLALGGPTAGAIDIGVSVPELSLLVNTIDGSVSIRNNSGIDLPEAIEYYEVRSDEGLSPLEWSSLDQRGVDQAGTGSTQGWSAGPEPTSSLVTEAFLDGGSLFANGRSESLGKLYDESKATADLTFFYALADSNLLLEGDVELRHRRGAVRRLQRRWPG